MLGWWKTRSGNLVKITELFGSRYIEGFIFIEIIPYQYIKVYTLWQTNGDHVKQTEFDLITRKREAENWPVLKELE